MKEIEKILLVCGGQKENASFIKKEAKAADFVLALDGGADICLAAKITPDLVLGDLDSITEKAKEIMGEERLIKIDRQDNTDLEKGLDFAAWLEVKKAVIICACGGRLDFTLSNFSSVFAHAKQIDISVKGKDWQVIPARATRAGYRRAFKCKAGARVSLIPQGKVNGLTLKNLKYPLKNAVLETGQSAVSNVALKDNFEISFKCGKLLIYSTV